MAQYDGSIRINTELVIKSLKKDTAEAEKILKSMAQSITEMEKNASSSDAFKNIQKQIAETEERLQGLKDKRNAWLEAGGGAEDGYFKSVVAEIEKFQAKLDSLRESQKSLSAGGQGISFSSESEQEAYNNALSRRQQLTERIEANNQRIAELQSQGVTEEERLEQIRGNAVVSNERIVEAVERRKELLQEITDLEKAGTTSGYKDYDDRQQELVRLNREIREYGSQTERVKNSYRQLGSVAKTSLDSIGKALKQTNSLIDGFGKRIKQAFTNLSKSADSSGKSALTTGKILKSILKYGFGIRSIYALVNKIRAGIKEGFSNFTQYSTQFKSSVDGLKSSALTLKNAFAAAFAPIVELAIPYIQKLIDYLVRLMDVVGQVMAAITGQKSYTKAIKQTTGAIEEQNKAQNKQLSSLDKLNNQTSNSGGSTGSGAADMFEEVPIESRWKDMADRIKKIGEDFFKPLKEAWSKEGRFVMDSWKYALDEIKKLVKDIGRDFLEVWRQDKTVAMFENILHIIGDIGLVVGNLAKNFREAWNTNKVGLHIFENIRDILAAIIHNIRLAADYTVEWSKTLDFYPLLSKIEEWTRSLVPVFDTLSGVVTDFYTMVLLPLGKWTLEKGLPQLLQVFIDFNNKVDWGALRSNLAEFWRHLEPFAEKVGEELILFIRDVSDALANFINSETLQNFLKAVADWMDKVTPRDVADGLEKLAKAMISIKLALVGFKAVTSAVKGLTMAKAFFAIWGSGNGAAMAGEMTAAAGGISGLSGALAAFAGNAALAAFEPFKKFTTDFDNNAEARFYEEYKGISGTLNLVKDSFKDFSNDISTFENAMETVNEGIILTDEQMQKLSRSTGFCRDDIESLTEGMIDLHPELAEVREEFGLWDAYPETLSNIAQGIGLIKDGTVDAGSAFEEFRKPMWNMTEDALAFFGQIQDGTVKVTDAHSSMKEQVVMNNGEITASNEVLEIDLSDHTAEWTTDMQVITDEHGNMVLDVTQGSDSLRDTFDSNNAEISTSNDAMAQNFSDNADNITDKVSDIEGSLNENKGGFSSWAESVMGSFKSVWEGAKMWIGKVIDKIGELMGSISSTVKGAFSGSGGISTAAFSMSASPYSAMPQMAALSKMEFPGYATGQVIPTSMKKHLAWLGDNPRETEVVSPLSTIKQANKESLLEVLSELGLTGINGRSAGNETFVFQVDGKTFFEITRGEAQRYFSRTGKSPYPT